MEDSLDYDCPHCGEPITIAIDFSAGRRQQFVDDCPVCCRPIVVHVEISRRGEVKVYGEQE